LPWTSEDLNFGSMSYEIILAFLILAFLLAELILLNTPVRYLQPVIFS